MKLLLPACDEEFVVERALPPMHMYDADKRYYGYNVCIGLEWARLIRVQRTEYPTRVWFGSIEMNIDTGYLEICDTDGNLLINIHGLPKRLQHPVAGERVLHLYFDQGTFNYGYLYGYLENTP